MKVAYLHKNLGAVTLKRIEQANKIIEEYQAKGYDLTVRQIYYQFVTRGLMPNEVRSYKLVANALEKGRLTGLVDWKAIIDRTRRVYSNNHWDNPEEILNSCVHSYALDSRATQDTYIEVWIEKNALLGAIEPICEQLDVTYLPCIGYYSLSSMWRAARRFGYEGDKKCVILYLGDHDPSGLDINRVISDTLDTFQCTNIKVKRIALNLDQIDEFNPPPNPAKLSDTRAAEYIAQYGESSWELDALPPDVIANLVKKHVNLLTDQGKRSQLLELQEEQREKLQDVVDNWED